MDFDVSSRDHMPLREAALRWLNEYYGIKNHRDVHRRDNIKSISVRGDKLGVASGSFCQTSRSRPAPPPTSSSPQSRSTCWMLSKGTSEQEQEAQEG